MRESPHVEVCFSNFRSKYVVPLISAQTYCLMWSFKSKCLWPNTSSCRKRQSLAYTGLPQARKWSGVKFFKAREKSGNLTWVQDWLFGERPGKIDIMEPLINIFFEILSVSVYGLVGGSHVFYYFGLIWSGKFYSYQGKVTKKSGNFDMWYLQEPCLNQFVCNRDNLGNGLKGVAIHLTWTYSIVERNCLLHDKHPCFFVLSVHGPHLSHLGHQSRRTLYSMSHSTEPETDYGSKSLMFLNLP